MYNGGIKYKVVDGKGLVLYDHEQKAAPCFADYMFSMGQKLNPNHIVFIYINKDQTAEKNNIYSSIAPAILPPVLSREQFYFHFDELAKEGFLNSVSEDEKSYIVRVKSCDYFNNSHLRMGLDFFRMVTEIGPHVVLPEYWKLSEEIRNKTNYFIAIQAVYIYLVKRKQIKGGHTLPTIGFGAPRHGCLVSGETIKKYLYGKLHSTGSFHVYNEIIGTSEPNSENINFEILDLFKEKDFDSIVNICRYVNPKKNK